MPAKKNTSVTTPVTPALQRDSIEYRTATRNEILTTEDKRVFRPIDYAAIRPVVCDEYLGVFDSAVAKKQEKTVRIDLNRKGGKQFLRAWMLANGKNRTPKGVHYNRLAVGFQAEFVPSATHWVVSTEGMITNAGHSGIATALAYFPPDIFQGIFPGKEPVCGADEKPILATSKEGKEMIENDEYWIVGDDNLIYPSVIYKLPEGCRKIGEYDENGRYVPGTDSPEIRESRCLECTLVINAPPKSCLKMDDVRLEADYHDHLEMIGPLKTYLETLPGGLDTADLGMIFLNWYKRTNHKGSGKDTTFGSVGKGGRPNKADVQQWAIAAMPHLLLSLQYLMREDKTGLRPFPCWTKTKLQKGGIHLAYALTAMMVSDDSGRQRIANLLTRNLPANDNEIKEENVRQFRELVLVPNEAKYTPIGADPIVEALILYGLGRKTWVDDAVTPIPIEGSDKTKTPWQDVGNRASGWDANSLDLGEEDYTKVLAKAASDISELLANPSAAQSAARKATRKGVGTRGPNKGKGK